MKTLKIQLDEKILKSLDNKAKELGMKTNASIQMILGIHVKDEKITKEKIHD